MNGSEPATKGLVLEGRPLLSLAVVTILYLTQGIPAALFFVVVPTWLTVQGYSVAEVATVVAATGAPPTFKFLAGLFVDRYAYRPMGRRKPWIAVGQVLMTSVMILGALTVGPTPSIALISIIAFAAMAGAAIQDVAVDSLIIDLFSEKERNRSAGFTYGAATIGMGSMIFIGGQLIETVGLAGVFAILSILPVLTLVMISLMRERPGEILAPWSKRAFTPTSANDQASSWLTVGREILALVIRPLPLLFLILCASRFVSSGVADALYPTLATQDAGWELERYTDLSSIALFVSGAVGFVLGGMVLPKIGTRIANLVILPMLVALYLGFALLPELRTDDLALTAFLLAHSLLGVALTVATLPICMRLCSPAAAATQFAIFMAVLNSGRPTGAALSGALGYEGFSTILMILSGLLLANWIVFLLVRFEPQGNVNQLTPEQA